MFLITNKTVSDHFNDHIVTVKKTETQRNQAHTH